MTLSTRRPRPPSSPIEAPTESPIGAPESFPDAPSMEMVEQPGPEPDLATCDILVYYGDPDKPQVLEFASAREAAKAWKAVDVAMMHQPRSVRTATGMVVKLIAPVAVACSEELFAEMYPEEKL